MSEPRGPNPPDDDQPGGLVYLFDLVSSAGAVVAVGLLLFAISGVWPPLVAIESGSMEPHIDTGDLVFVMDEDRFAGEGAYADTGVVPANRGADTGYRSFQNDGDVIVFQPDGDGASTPVIHRAMFWVNESENWYDKADPAYINADSCEELRNCPADSAGFVTKGDNNAGYDQVNGLPSCGPGACDPVRKSWVVGTAETRVPLLGNIRLQLQRALA
ncbi:MULTISPECIES: S26 family signal peptidase [Halomicrobium]|uniref:Signal sequence peptidase n=2 Tax=Halomicrobium mukohataei TaxID=57705 RepID=C7P039_HALMD|nr:MULTISPECIES: S26 family signal peptidase [Halomicrobium]ACV46947.1 signal sequence peptidase [Halomicrobium mukohataei DSM 12286]QCD65442.1 S26 family signal peptidase [Halomicrobium mukohataei]QFR20248.1 S26 family signal peptidase [Halomicrobium sp. ZPS1]